MNIKASDLNLLKNTNFNGVAGLQEREKQIDRDIIRAMCENGGKLDPGNYGSFIVLEKGRVSEANEDKNSLEFVSAENGVYSFKVNHTSSATAKKYAEFGTSYSKGDCFEISSEYESNRNKYVMNDPYDYYGITTHKFNTETGLYDRYLNGSYVKSVDNKYDAYGYRTYVQEREDLDQAYFFHADLDFLMEAAEEYAKINSDQEYVYRPIMDDSFVRSTIDWFTQGMGGESDYKQLQKSIDNIVKELAEKLRKGEDTSLDKLDNKLNILGEEITVSELIKIQKKSLELSNNLGTIGYGTDKLADNAKWGTIKKQGMAYGDKLGGKLGRLYSAAFAAEVDLHVKKCYETSSSLENQIQYGKEIYEQTSKEEYDEKALDDIIRRYNRSVNNSASTDKIKSQIQEFILRFSK